MNTVKGKLLFEGKFGKPGFLAWMGLTVAGLGIAMFVLVILAKGIDSIDLLAGFLITSLVFIGLLVFWASLKMQGKFSLFTDRLEWKKGKGKDLVHNLEEIESINFHPKHLFFTVEKNKTKLVLARLNPKGSVGWVWMLWKYREFPPLVFEKAVSAQQSEHLAYGVRREFLDKSEGVAFFDVGFVLKLPDGQLFLPVTDTAVLPKVVSTGGIKTAVTDGPRLHFEPDPGALPIQLMAEGILACGFDQKQTAALFGQMAERHGGCYFSPEGKKGEAFGMKVIFRSLGK